MTNATDCYGILGVSSDATPEEIQLAYDYANDFFSSKNYTGDKNYAQQYLEDARKAYITLSDPRFRYMHDEHYGITNRYEGKPIPHLNKSIIYPGYTETGDLFKDKLALFTIPKMTGYNPEMDYSYMPYSGCFGIEQSDIPKITERYEAAAEQCEELVKEALIAKKRCGKIAMRLKYSAILEKLQFVSLALGGIGSVLFVIWLLLRILHIIEGNTPFEGFPQSCISAAVIGFGSAVLNPVKKDQELEKMFEDARSNVEKMTLDNAMIGYVQYACAMQEYDNYRRENGKAEQTESEFSQDTQAQ